MIRRIHIHTTSRDRRGFILLLVIVLLAAFFSIAMGIINILLGQVVIIGQAGESFGALYAADIGMEHILYHDRTQNLCGTLDVATGQSICNSHVDFANGGCYTAIVQIGPSASCPGPSTRCIDVTGQDVCGASERYVQRRFSIQYP